MSKLDTTSFDIAKHLNNKETIAEYLTQVLVDGDIDEILEALDNTTKALSANKVEICSNKYIGCSFDDFLKEDGIYEETSSAAIKATYPYRS